MTDSSVSGSTLTLALALSLITLASPMSQTTAARLLEASTMQPSRQSMSPTRRPWPSITLSVRRQIMQTVSILSPLIGPAMQQQTLPRSLSLHQDTSASYLTEADTSALISPYRPLIQCSPATNTSPNRIACQQHLFRTASATRTGQTRVE